MPNQSPISFIQFLAIEPLVTRALSLKCRTWITNFKLLKTNVELETRMSNLKNKCWTWKMNIKLEKQMSNLKKWMLNLKKECLTRKTNVGLEKWLLNLKNECWSWILTRKNAKYWIWHDKCNFNGAETKCGTAHALGILLCYSFSATYIVHVCSDLNI